ncbi:hypothetical protein JCM19238_4687 [Vibrio ponticus]|nr:hypothetical protein JCM19238_4687 [Vibrio ponticus]
MERALDDVIIEDQGGESDFDLSDSGVSKLSSMIYLALL